MIVTSETDHAFIRQVIVELYDEEVARHPEGIPWERAIANIKPRVAAILAEMEGSR